jgi:hypothetical protein
MIKSMYPTGHSWSYLRPVLTSSVFYYYLLRNGFGKFSLRADGRRVASCVGPFYSIYSRYYEHNLNQRIP